MVNELHGLDFLDEEWIEAKDAVAFLQRVLVSSPDTGDLSASPYEELESLGTDDLRALSAALGRRKGI